jgi:hypothetical protein
VTISYNSACIFIALKRHPYISLIFQKGEEPPHTFFFGPFEFTLIVDVDGIDVCLYRVTEGVFTFIITFIGVDFSVPCWRRLNVDFVDFIWQNNDILGFRRYALKFLPNTPFTHRRLLCLRHYRVASMGWVSLQDASHVLTIFKRDSGLSQAAWFLLRLAPVMSANADLLPRGTWLHTSCLPCPEHGSFVLTRDVTYEQCVSALTSKRSTVTGLLPPDFPYISIRFRYRIYSGRSDHLYCSPALP